MSSNSMCWRVSHYDFCPPSPSEHSPSGFFSLLQRGAGTELVVEMQDLLNVPHAFAVLGRCLPGAPPQISCQRCTRCLQRARSKELPPGAGTCVKRHAGGELGAEITPHEPAINPHHEWNAVTCPNLPCVHPLFAGRRAPMRAANHQSLIKISSWAPRLSSISFCSASTDRLCPW